MLRTETNYLKIKVFVPGAELGECLLSTLEIQGLISTSRKTRQ